MNLTIILLAIIFIAGISGFMGVPANYNFNKKIADVVQQKYFAMAEKNNLFLFASPIDAISIICVETGSYVIQGKNSSNIPFGDSGESIGLMQVKESVWKKVLAQSNQENLPGLDDLTNDETNIVAGMTILDQDLARVNGNKIRGYELYNNGITKKEYAIAVNCYHTYFKTRGL